MTVACANILDRPDAVEQAAEEARTVIEHRDQLFGRAAVIGAVRKAQRLFDQVVAAA
ncbi:hypothetical protein [Streptomyces abikoensis]|uniref:hypothetical protein n=1 Tax=Streptomyces abikoensis TaxID=97398 RepID=UPI0016748720|nr:hypothetical protein [Streptomyces abikoensis]GGP44742.1 hypothetical protein GCM10010214_17020 [Streptomyces abikoensis]